MEFRIRFGRARSKLEIFAEIRDSRQNSRFSPKFQIFAEISDFRQNFRFSPKFEIFAQIRDFRSKRSKMFSRSRQAARPLPPPRPWPRPWPWPKFNFRIYIVPNLIRRSITITLHVLTTEFSQKLSAVLTGSA